jgi:dihydrofolate reductase
MIALIAVSKNNIIGNDGVLPWHVKEDLEWFKHMTLNKSIVVGYNTYEKLPVLKDRSVLVLSEKHDLNSFYDPIKNYSMCTVTFEKLMVLKNIRPLVVCGGNQTYISLLPYINYLYVTRLNFDAKGDTSFDIDLDQHFNPPSLYRILSEKASVYLYVNKSIYKKNI